MGKVPPRALCFQFVFSESIPNPGGRPKPFLEALRLTPARHPCKHLHFAHRRAAAACTKAGWDVPVHIKKKGPLAFLLESAGHRAGAMRLSKSFGLGTRSRRRLLLLLLLGHQGILTTQRNAKCLPIAAPEV